MTNVDLGKVKGVAQRKLNRALPALLMLPPLPEIPLCDGLRAIYPWANIVRDHIIPKKLMVRVFTRTDYLGLWRVVSRYNATLEETGGDPHAYLFNVCRVTPSTTAALQASESEGGEAEESSQTNPAPGVIATPETTPEVVDGSNEKSEIVGLKIDGSDVSVVVEGKFINGKYEEKILVDGQIWTEPEKKNEHEQSVESWVVSIVAVPESHEAACAQLYALARTSLIFGIPSPQYIHRVNTHLALEHGSIILNKKSEAERMRVLLRRFAWENKITTSRDRANSTFVKRVGRKWRVGFNGDAHKVWLEANWSKAITRTNTTEG